MLGLAVATSSLAVTSAVLEDLGCLVVREARIIVAAAIFDGLICVIAASVLNKLVLVKGWSMPGLALLLGEVVATGLLVTTVGPRVPARSRPLIARFHLRRASLTITLAVALGLAALADTIGLPAILGAYLAGLAIIEGWLGDEVYRDIGPIYVFLVPFFFVIAGTDVHLRQLLNVRDATLVIGIFLVAVLPKLAACGAGAGSLGRRQANVDAVGMVTHGSTALMIASIGRVFGILGSDLFGVAVLVIVATMVIGPLGLKAVLRGCPLPPRWRRSVGRRSRWFPTRSRSPGRPRPRSDNGC